jgi:hypothetical protein
MYKSPSRTLVYWPLYSLVDPTMVKVFATRPLCVHPGPLWSEGHMFKLENRVLAPFMNLLCSLWQLITITTLINGCKNTNRTYVSLVSRMPIIVLSYPILALIVTLMLTFAKVANPVTFTPGQR